MTMNTDRNDPLQEPALSSADEAALEALFAQSRAAPAQASDALLARIEAEALALQPRKAVAPAPAPRPAARRGWRLGLGGWSSLGGLTAALVVGFGVGLSAPDAVTGLTGTLLDSGPGLEDVFWGIDADLLEG